MTSVLISEAKLQVAASFLPGRICESHISQVAKKLLEVVSHVTFSTGVVSRPVAQLTEKLGEPGPNGQTMLDWTFLDHAGAHHTVILYILAR